MNRFALLLFLLPACASASLFDGDAGVITYLAKQLKQLKMSHEKLTNTQHSIEVMRRTSEESVKMRDIYKNARAISGAVSDLDDIERRTKKFADDPYGVNTIRRDIKERKEALERAQNDPNGREKVRRLANEIARLERLEWLQSRSNDARLAVAGASESEKRTIATNTALAIESLMRTLVVDQSRAAEKAEKKQQQQEQKAVDSIRGKMSKKHSYNTLKGRF